MSNTHTNKTDNKPAKDVTKAPVTDRNRTPQGDMDEDTERKRPAA